MASSSPLPITNPQTTGQSQPPIATPAFRAFINHFSDTIRNALSQRRPWSEIVDRTAFTRPTSLSDAVSRARKNFTYFRINYFTVLASVVAVSLLTHPFSLLVLLCVLAAWIFLYLFRSSDTPLVLFGRTFSDKETLGLLSLSSIVVIFLTSVGSLLISAVMIGLLIVFAHGAFRDPEDLFLDEQESASVGFLSFLGGVGNPAPPSAPPTGGSRV